MSLSENERQIIVRRELVIMRDNADDNCFFEADEEKLKPFLEPTRLLIEKIKQYVLYKKNRD